jgi:hypothetical protein
MVIFPVGLFPFRARDEGEQQNKFVWLVEPNMLT